MTQRLELPAAIEGSNGRDDIGSGQELTRTAPESNARSGTGEPGSGKPTLQFISAAPP